MSEYLGGHARAALCRRRACCGPSSSDRKSWRDRASLVRNFRASPGWDRAALAFICLAAAFRIALWLQQRSLWIDEARLSLNVASRSYLGLLPPLDYDQTAPLLYLWVERFTARVFGVSEAPLRLPALAAGIATVALIFCMARRLFGRRAAILATAMSALSPTLIHFSSEVKQYSVEACVSCAAIYLGLRWLEDPSDRGRWLPLVALGVVATWFATPAPFVLASAGLAVLLTPGLPVHRRVRPAVSLALWWGGSLALAYLWVYRHAAHDIYLRHYWNQAFLTPVRPSALLDTGVAVGSVLWGPLAIDRLMGVANLGTVVFVPAVAIAIALFLAIGVRRLVRAVGSPGSALVLGPLILALVASTFQLYPISARTTMFYLPTLIALAAAGVEEFAGRWRSPLVTWAVMIVACVPLAWIAIGELGNADPREHLRPLVALLQARRLPAEPVYVFAGAIPAWAMYTTDWKSPDTVRLDYLRRIARAGGPAFENAPSRGRAVRDEGSGLTYPGLGGLEVYGIPDGLEARVFGLTNSMPDAGWAENEARRIREVADPGVWLILSHFYGPEGILLRALEADGADMTYHDFRNGAALVRYEFPS
jgi:4-amino-4-deoxy-L-arabinose transferase-like glycosyltransferase